MEEILSPSRSLKVHVTHSAGTDDLDPYLIISVLDLIAKPLAAMINGSFSNGIIPDKLKIVKAIPIHKQAFKDDVKNTIGLHVSQFCLSFQKNSKKSMYVRLYDFINKQGILCSTQHGFQPGHSTMMSLINLQDKISEAMDRNEYAIGVFIDIAKAFDTVDHRLLLKKLDNIGVRGVALDWFQNYLSNRHQYVSCNGFSSSLLYNEIDSLWSTTGVNPWPLPFSHFYK